MSAVNSAIDGEHKQWVADLKEIYALEDDDGEEHEAIVDKYGSVAFNEGVSAANKIGKILSKYKGAKARSLDNKTGQYIYYMALRHPNFDNIELKPEHWTPIKRDVKVLIENMHKVQTAWPESAAPKTSYVKPKRKVNRS